MKNTKRMISAVMAAMLAGMLMAGCAGEAQTAPAAQAAPAQGAESAAAGDTAPTFKVGIVSYMDHASLNQIEENVKNELDAQSAERGCKFVYDGYSFNGQGDATIISQQLAQLKDDAVDAVVVIATPTALTAQSVFEDTDTPVIFSAVTDPVGAGLVDSFEVPGGRITGTSDMLNTEAIMELIFAQDPDADKIGLLYSTSEDASTQAIADAKAFLDAKGVAYVEKTGTNINEVTLAVDALIGEGVSAIFTPTDNTIMSAELSIYEKLIEAGIPHYTGADSFALNGAFLGFGINYADLGTETADIVAEILGSSKSPADYPVVTLDNGIATVNTETAEALGYDLDAVKEAFAPFCSEIVEITTAESF